MDIDLQARIATFNWLSEQVDAMGDVLPRKLLEKGFDFQGQHIPLVAPQGIFKPQILDLPLSITTAPKGPYDDYFGKDNFGSSGISGKNPAFLVCERAKHAHTPKMRPPFPVKAGRAIIF